LSFARNEVQYLRLRAGDTTFAYLYNFVCAGNAHFYLSGIDYSVGEQYRPGLLAHWLAIERNLSAGHHSYDFLAGDARYKRSLCTGQDRTVWLVLQRPRWRLQLEGFARRLKNRLPG
jgi:CelD/BcsL family acetyltransferase involved in cellulose biosynthesis